MITPIPAMYVVPVWPKVRGHVEAALTQTDSGFTPEDVLKKLIISDMQLWVADDYKAAAVTQISVYPRFKSCVIVALGGDDMGEWFDDFLTTVEAWASRMGCKYVDEYGRKGWKRLGERRGYDQVYTVMRKQVNG